MDDLEKVLTSAAFYEQMAGDFPEQEFNLGNGVTWTRKPARGWKVRLGLWVAWLRQGRPRHRGVVLQVGTAVRGDVGWVISDWGFDAFFCPGVPALHYELVGGVMFLRAVCGWHLPDLEAAASGLRIRSIW